MCVCVCVWAGVSSCYRGQEEPRAQQEAAWLQCDAYL